MREDIYFCLDLTESEHEIISSELSEVCATNGLELVYYRKLKEGHIPMIREIKVRFHGKQPIFSDLCLTKVFGIMPNAGKTASSPIGFLTPAPLFEILPCGC